MTGRWLVRQVFPEPTGRLGQVLDLGRGEVTGGNLGVDLDATVGRDEIFGNCWRGGAQNTACQIFLSIREEGNPRREVCLLS